MGQLIEVTATPVGDTALFDLDRSLTGQDGLAFSSAPLDGEWPAVLARRLWERDEAVDNVYILSNNVTVRRVGGWDEESLGVASDVIARLFVHYETPDPEERDERLREENYNASISWIREHNPDLWVMRIKPDVPVEPFKAGQYTTLALGYWEPRADGVEEDFSDDPAQRGKMARRSYSVSSSMIDDNGDLVPPHPEEVEFYIVRVPPDKEEIPALTPRIFTKGVGDRIYMGAKFTGRYTLDGVEPTDNVVFLATGTGEAPHNKMTAELLRTGHTAKILSVVCVRYRQDLAYAEQHAAVESQFPQYRHVALTTREPENEGNKIYIQELITSGRLEEELGTPLDPQNTHVFLCGNPAMIGIPTRDDDTGELAFPEPLGVCEILHDRGFTIDHRKSRGNVHYEEYWSD
jgi:ferredoxin/flavodoxin---NADP+ reductase